MEVDFVSLADTGFFSPLMLDYIKERLELKPFYHKSAKAENFDSQIGLKQAHYPLSRRLLLSEALHRQYGDLGLTEPVQKNLDRLSKQNTFTITTGHQLNLFTGPLYFFYKIINAINMAAALEALYPNNHFVPVYWMASEDHDFEEINYFKYQNQKINWDSTQKGAVGRFSTVGLSEVYEVLKNQLPQSQKSKELLELFKKSYLDHDSLSAATRYLVNQLFGTYGLVIIDGDDPILKSIFAPYIARDLQTNISYNEILKQSKSLTRIQASYKMQVNPREVNYFYLGENLRERLVPQSQNSWAVQNTNIKFTLEELEQELKHNPQRFSPNAVTRPLYQEVILPNLCYIGGGGELAYWFQLKEMFKAFEVPFPILRLRNSVLIASQKQKTKLKKLELEWKDCFQPQNEVINKYIRRISNIEIDFSPQKNHLKKQFEGLYELAKNTDSSFLGAVAAQEKKQLKGLDHLEKRLLKAQKRKLRDRVIRVSELQNELFPNRSLQERHDNFSKFYLELGSDLIPFLKERLQPFSEEFNILLTP